MYYYSFLYSVVFELTVEDLMSLQGASLFRFQQAVAEEEEQVRGVVHASANCACVRPFQCHTLKKIEAWTFANYVRLCFQISLPIISSSSIDQPSHFEAVDATHEIHCPPSPPPSRPCDAA